jgi:hypothetical protein
MAFRSITLQRPRRDREQGLQHTAAENQHADCERARQRAWLRRGDDEQDHARQPRARCIRPERDEQAAADAPDERRKHDEKRLAADEAADQRRQRRRCRGQQHPVRAQPIRAGLVGEHRVERAGRDAQTGIDVPCRDTDRERQHDRKRIAYGHAQRHVAWVELDQGVEHGGIVPQAAPTGA